MNHPPPHGNQELTNPAHHRRVLERYDAAGRESKVDRSAALAFPATRVGPAVVQVDREAAARQQHREKGACQAGADDVDRRPASRLHGWWRRAWPSASAPRKASAKLL